MHVDPMNPMLKPPGSKRLKLNCDTLLSSFAFKFNLRRYAEARRAQSLLTEAMAELERVRNFAVGPGRHCPPRHGHHPHRH